ncbi:hypothetical protein KIL84_002000 [Mauremys mutica]|uniref:Uncharacterized protein n=1 Tax=Mauremys mutica TaxID=74926 RepID=A0A9D4B590_9SAUR|nr:hypothetical protein KIL84_002000 [Mauremys mutica]
MICSGDNRDLLLNLYSPHHSHLHLTHLPQNRSFENLVESLRHCHLDHVLPLSETIYQFADHLTTFYPTWQNFTSEKWVLEFIGYGYPIPYLSLVPNPPPIPLQEPFSQSPFWSSPGSLVWRFREVPAGSR